MEGASSLNRNLDHKKCLGISYSARKVVFEISAKDFRKEQESFVFDIYEEPFLKESARIFCGDFATDPQAIHKGSTLWIPQAFSCLIANETKC